MSTFNLFSLYRLPAKKRKEKLKINIVFHFSSLHTGLAIFLNFGNYGSSTQLNSTQFIKKWQPEG